MVVPTIGARWFYGSASTFAMISLTRLTGLGPGHQTTHASTLKEHSVSTPHKTVDIAFLQDFAAAWNRHDLEALMGFMAEDSEFHAVAGPDLLGRSFKGLQAIREGFALAWQTFPDAAWLDGDHFVCGDRGVSESTFCGTKADGTRIEARMVDVFTFRDGKIATKNAYRKDRPAIAAK